MPRASKWGKALDDIVLAVAIVLAGMCAGQLFGTFLELQR